MVYNKLRDLERSLAAVFIVVALLMAVPYVWGVGVESHFRTQMEQMATALQSRFTVVQYRRGWLGSSAITRLELPGAVGVLLFRHEISHGPIDFERLFQGKSPWVKAVIRSELPEQRATRGFESYNSLDGSLFKAFTTIDLNGQSDTFFASPYTSALLDSVDFDQLLIAGMNGHLVYLPQAERLHGHLNIPRLELLGPQGGVRLHHIHLESDQKRGESRLFFGGSRFTLSQLEWLGEGGPLRVSQLELNSMNAENQGEAFTQFSVEAGSLSLAEFGDYSPVAFDLTLRHLDAPLLAQLLNGVRQLPAPSREERPDAPSLLWLAQSEPMLRLARNSEVELSRFSMKQGGHEITAWLRGRMPGLTSHDWEEGAFPLQALEVELELALSDYLMQFLFEQQTRRMVLNTQRFAGMRGLKAAEKEPYVRKSAESQLNNLVNQSYLAYQDGNYLLRFSLKGGRFYISDRPLNP